MSDFSLQNEIYASSFHSLNLLESKETNKDTIFITEMKTMYRMIL